MPADLCFDPAIRAAFGFCAGRASIGVWCRHAVQTQTGNQGGERHRWRCPLFADLFLGVPLFSA